MSDYIAEFIINIWVSFLFLILANGKLNRRSFRYSYLLQILSVLVLAECLITGCHAGSRYHQIPDYTIGLTLPVYLYILYVPDQQSVLGRYILHSRTCFQIHSDHIPCRMAAHRCRWDADGSCSTKPGIF